MIDEDLGASGYDWLDHDELHQSIAERLRAEDRMDEHEQADFLLEDDR